MAQTFFPITPVEVTPGTADDWIDVDVSGNIASGATGVVLHWETTTAYALGFRKNGSTDNRTQTSFTATHGWVAFGVDASRIFEAYVGHTTNVNVWLVGYTVAGVTFATNAADKSLGTTGSWIDIDCSSEAPSAIGLLFEVTASTSSVIYGIRENGSTDTRTGFVQSHNSFMAVYGCDGSQLVEGNINSTDIDFWLVGYITDGCTLNTNATDLSLGSTGAWTDLSALPANANMGFIQVVSGGAQINYGLRKNGSSEDIYRLSTWYPFGIVECDSSQIIEGQIANVGCDFFLTGYSTAVAAAGASVNVVQQMMAKRRN